MAVALFGFHFAADNPRFLLAVPHAPDADLVARIDPGPQGLAEPSFVMGDQAGGGAQYVRRRAVIALQADHPRARKVLLEFQDVADLGAAPGIDGLVVVADAAQVLAGLGKQPQPEILGHVGILVFVHQQIAETVLILGQNIRVLGEQGQIVEQQVAEIGRVEGAEPVLIRGVELHQTPVGHGAAFLLRHLFRRQAAILPALDDAQQHPGRPLPVVDTVAFHHLLQQPQLVVRIENGEVGFEAGSLGVAAENSCRQGMERPQPPSFHRTAGHRGDPVFHFPGGLVGERDGDDLTGVRQPGHQDVGEPGRQHPGLAGAGAGKHQDRTLGRLHGAPLFLVQALEIGRLGGGSA